MPFGPLLVLVQATFFPNLFRGDEDREKSSFLYIHFFLLLLAWRSFEMACLVVFAKRTATTRICLHNYTFFFFAQERLDCALAHYTITCCAFCL
jgi:hypothetical protein